MLYLARRRRRRRLAEALALDTLAARGEQADLKRTVRELER